jgi:hypothetical protein
MAYSYSGDPSASDLDKYRFSIGDIGEVVETAEVDATPLSAYFPVDATPLTETRDNFIMSDEEITFILNNYTSHNTRLYYLFNSCANILSRNIKRSLGPQYEDPTTRTAEYRTQAEYYKKLSNSSGLSLPVYASEKCFSKGMNDYV